MRTRAERGTSGWVRGIVVGLGLAAGLAAASAAQERPAEPQGEGIKVHGHWVIEVRNPDGSLASRNEFENRLGRPSVLSSILARRHSVGSWQIMLEVGPAICAMGTQPMSSCEMFESLDPVPPLPPGTTAVPAIGNWRFRTLIMTEGPTTPTVSLSGSMKATFAGRITAVHTQLYELPSNVPASPAQPAPLSGSPYSEFTDCTIGDAQSPIPCAGISAPIDIQANQTIDLTVVISFS